LQESRELWEKHESDLHQDFEKRSAEERERHEQELIAQRDEIRFKEKAQNKAAFIEKIKTRSDKIAKIVVVVAQAVLAVLFFASFMFDSIGIFEKVIYLSILTKILLGLVGGASLLDLMGNKLVSKQFDKVRAWLSFRLQQRLISELV